MSPPPARPSTAWPTPRCPSGSPGWSAAPPRRQGAEPATPAPAAPVRLRLEATEDDPGRAAHAWRPTRERPRLTPGRGSSTSAPGAGATWSCSARAPRASSPTASSPRPPRPASGPCATPTRSPTSRRRPRGRSTASSSPTSSSGSTARPRCPRAGAIEHALAPSGVAIVEGIDPAGLGDARRLLARPRPAAAGPPRRRADGARVGRAGLHDRRGARRSGRRDGRRRRAATPCMRRADGPRVAFVVPRYGAGVVGGAEMLCRLMAENLVGPRHGRRGADHVRRRPLHLGGPPPRGHHRGERRARAPLPAEPGPRQRALLRAARADRPAHADRPGRAARMDGPVGVVAGPPGRGRGRRPLRLARRPALPVRHHLLGRRGPPRAHRAHPVRPRRGARLAAGGARDAGRAPAAACSTRTARASSCAPRARRRGPAGERGLRRRAPAGPASGCGASARRGAIAPGYLLYAGPARGRPRASRSSTPPTPSSRAGRPDAPRARADGARATCRRRPRSRTASSTSASSPTTSATPPTPPPPCS